MRGLAWAAQAAFLAPLALVLAACGGSDAGKTTGGGTQEIRAEAACLQDGLEKPKRQTLILVDSHALQKTADAESFAQANTAFRDFVLSIADPDKAVAGGLAVPRERVTIAVIPSDGSGADVAFTGCIPGLTPDELASAASKQSLVSSAISSGPAGKVQAQIEAFRQQLIGGMVSTAGKADGSPAPQSGVIADARFFQGVRASRSLWDSKDLVARLILVSDISALSLGDEATEDAKTRDTPFTQGVEAGRRAGGDLGQAEVHLVLPAERPIPNQEYLRGYFLAQNGALASTAVRRVSASPPPPKRLWRFAGEAAYPSGAVPIDIRIGDDGNGKLSGSWLVVLSDPRFAIPLVGQIACATAEDCRISSDSNGFAQIWSGASPAKPAFSSDLPFGGMRNAALEISGSKLTGRISDDAVTVGKDRDRNWIAIKADAKQL